ncbi:MAG: chorismate synthase [Clostridia bacterium]|nr:chorismate synthase [Clostridia bacterium]
MSSMIGNRLKLSIFGESHGRAIGCVVDGLPAGEWIDAGQLMQQMRRRAPGQDPAATARKEEDIPRILSGVMDGVTTGAPVCCVIDNQDPHSADYAALADTPRPGHADYPAAVRYDGFADMRGGGHFSGRLTAPMVFAGALCRQILRSRGVVVGGHLAQIAGIDDTPIDPMTVTGAQLEELSAQPFPLLCPAHEKTMRAAIAQAAAAQDSVGGILEVAATGMPCGVGNPIFDGIENRLAALFFGIPGVKGVSFGDGFALAGMRGSEANDPYQMHDGRIVTESNHNGGLLGGLTNGMPITARLAVKPTPSIGREQRTVSLEKGENTTIRITGRHDPCIALRALPVAEALMAFGLLDVLLEG